MTLEEFLEDWNSPEHTVLVHTSGSTGRPKSMLIEKERMRASARMTCDFLDLHEGDTTLLCMPLDYIAGKMMVVRALERGMRLISTRPSNHPLEGLTEAPTFAAMVPSQVLESLNNPLLAQISKLIIGGGAIHPELEQRLLCLPNTIYSTYGMTETLSHVAMRKIGSPWYKPMSGVSLTLSEEGCLIIDAPTLCKETLLTHDIAELNEQGEFRIIGRTDNVICSGGIKIQIEEVEACLHSVFGDTIQITSLPHQKFGEIVVMLSTKPVDEHLLRLALPNPYWLPKRIFYIKELPTTATGKPDRALAKEIAQRESLR